MATRAYYLDMRTLKTPTIGGELANLQNTLNLKTYIQSVVDSSDITFDSIYVDIIGEKTSGHGVIVDSATIKDGTIKTAVGAVGTPAVQVGYADTGMYAVSGVQTGFSQDGALVGGFNASGLFTGVISEQTTDAGVQIDHITSALALSDDTIHAYEGVNTTDATTGNIVSILTGLTPSAAGTQTIEANKFVVTSDVALGAWANAVVGKVDLSATGYTSGLVGVICAELDMPTTAPSGGAGTYSLFEAEVNMAGAGGGVPIVVNTINVWGAQATDFDSHGYLFDITGVVAGTAGGTDFFTANSDTATHGIKCRINGTDYWIALTPATS